VAGIENAPAWWSAIAVFALTRVTIDSYDGVLLGQLLTGFIDMAEHQPLRMLMMLFEQLPRDYGFLVAKSGGMHEPFGPNDVPGFCLLSNDGPSLTSNAIKINGCMSFGSRCKWLVSECSWLFPMESGLAGADALWGHSIVKFHLYAGDHSESAIHELARAMGMPYVPKLLSTARMETWSENLTSKILIIEDAGQEVWDYI
ncbi:hypothetical protein LPJ61_004510, partial [Coemansia biformis]